MESSISQSSKTLSSSIQFGSKSLNPLDSIHPSVVNKIKRDADAYVGCSNRCAKIWQSLNKNQIAGTHLTQSVISVIFRQFENDLSTFAKVTSLRDFMKLFDQDKDGSLNYDEQIQIFSYIKERLENVANNCLQIQAYAKYETLMKEVRSLQNNIAQWQGVLRRKIHTNQIKEYRTEGEKSIDEFCDKFDQEYEKLMKTMLQRRQNFDKQAFYEAQALEERLNQPSEYLKIKPTNRIKELQFQEKLVSLEERVYQAIDFRRELNELQVKQKQRVDKLMEEHANQQRKNLQRKNYKKRKQLEQKLQELENKLIIKMKKQFEILKKKNNIHEVEIRRVQQLQNKWAKKKGIVEPEMKRGKKLQRKRNQVLSQYKKSMQGTGKLNEDTFEEQKPTMAKVNSKSLLSNTTKFRLTNKSESQIPVNTKINSQTNYISRIYRFLHPKNKEKNFSLCKLYNSELKEKQEKSYINQSVIDEQKTRKYNFMALKLF